MSREYIIVGDGEPVYVSETGTRQEILETVYLNETVVVAAGGSTWLNTGYWWGQPYGNSVR